MVDDPILTARMSAQQEADRLEWMQFEQQQLGRGRCPGSGLELVRRDVFDGSPDPGGPVMSCGACDCFGYDTSEVVPHVDAVLTSVPES